MELVRVESESDVIKAIEKIKEKIKGAENLVCYVIGKDIPAGKRVGVICNITGVTGGEEEEKKEEEEKEEGE